MRVRVRDSQRDRYKTSQESRSQPRHAQRTVRNRVPVQYMYDNLRERVPTDNTHQTHRSQNQPVVGPTPSDTHKGIQRASGSRGAPGGPGSGQEGCWGAGLCREGPGSLGILDSSVMVLTINFLGIDLEWVILGVSMAIVVRSEVGVGVGW